MANLAAAPLTRENNTPHTAIDYAPQDAPIQDNVKVYNGAIICAENAGGYAIPGADTANARCLGVATETVDNTVAGHAAGALKVPYRTGVFAFDTGGDAACTQVDVGKLCYVLDDHTVVRVAGVVNNVIAGVVQSIDPNTGKVWVDMRRHSA